MARRSDAPGPRILFFSPAAEDKALRRDSWPDPAMAGLSRHQSVSAAAWRGQGSTRNGDRGDTGLHAGQADEAHARGGEAGSGRSKSRSSMKAAILIRDLNGLQADPVQAGSIDPGALQTYLQRSITGTLFRCAVLGAPACCRVCLYLYCS